MIQRIILFGASGDLTSRLWLPAIAQVAEDGQLPSDFHILGSALEDWSTEEYKERMADALEEFSGNVSLAARKRVVDMLEYRQADVTDASDVHTLIGDPHPPTLVYLALPTALLDKAFIALGGANLTAQDAVAIEKPFGVDLASAQHLNETLRTVLPLPTIFRIDHFLSDELVRRILILRFTNRIFEPLLNAQHVNRIEISWLEQLALEGRAGYYDRAGALKDMIQNHLLEALSLVLMEEPARFDEPSFRGNRVEAIRMIATPTPDSILTGTVRARYTAGSIEGRAIPSYVNEPGVDPSRNTETYASVKLEVPSSRWYGSQFLLRSGKALARNEAEIAIHFKDIRGFFGTSMADPSYNVLRIGLMEPYVRLDINLQGPDGGLVEDTLEMLSPKPKHSAYANLIIEMLNNRPALFIRHDEAEESWRIIDPVVKAWSVNMVPMREYPAGGEAPA